MKYKCVIPVIKMFNGSLVLDIKVSTIVKIKYISLESYNDYVVFTIDDSDNCDKEYRIKVQTFFTCFIKESSLGLY